MSNLTFLNTSNNFADLAGGITTNLGSLFPGVLLFIVFVSFYGLTIRNGATAAFMASSLVTTITGILMMFAGFATWLVVVIPVLMFLGSLAYRFFGGKD